MRVSSLAHFLLSCLFSFSLCSKSSNSEYSETAEITYLPKYNILLDLKFKLTQELKSESSIETDLGYFPALIYALTEEFGILSGKLSFTRGFWDSSMWAKPPHIPSSSGFQFNGRFINYFGSISIKERYDRAISLISGCLCASLNVLKYSNAIIPISTPSEYYSEVIGIIPSEPVCIENLQPWIAMLPSGSKAGLAQMIKPEAIYQSQYHVMEVEFHTTCKNEPCSIKDVSMLLRIITIYDLSRWDRQQTWSLASLLGKSYSTRSPLTSPKVIVKVPNDDGFLSSLIKQTKQISSVDGSFVLVYDEDDLINSAIGASDIPLQTKFLVEEYPFRSYRFKSGSTDDFGGFGIALDNFSTSPITVNIVESIPWLFNVFLNEAKISLNSNVIPASEIPQYLLEFLIEPSISRKRNLLLQSKWIIPAKSTIQIYFPFEREFLGINEFPQNSERGIELPGAIVTYEYKTADDDDSIRTFTETSNTVLFTWPLPDATMPFNAITMTSTLAALFYGAFFNLIFRRYYLKLPGDPPSGRIPNLLWNLKQKYMNRNMK